MGTDEAAKQGDPIMLALEDLRTTIQTISKLHEVSKEDKVWSALDDLFDKTLKVLRIVESGVTQAAIEANRGESNESN